MVGIVSVVTTADNSDLVDTQQILDKAPKFLRETTPVKTNDDTQDIQGILAKAPKFLQSPPSSEPKSKSAPASGDSYTQNIQSILAKAPKFLTDQQQPSPKSMDTGSAIGGTVLGVAQDIRGMGISTGGLIGGAAGLPFGKGAEWMKDTEDFMTKHTGLSPKQYASLGTKTKAAMNAVTDATTKVMNYPRTLADTGVNKDFKGRPMTPENLKSENQDRFVQDYVASVLPYLIGGEETGGKFKVRGDELPEVPEAKLAETASAPVGTPDHHADEFQSVNTAAKGVKPGEPTKPMSQPTIETGGRRAVSGIQQEVRKTYDSLTSAEREEIAPRDKLTKVYSQGIYHAMKGPERPQAFIDLRSFKKLQEPAGKSYSPGFGDEVLKTIGAKANELEIPLFRSGGDEFNILGDRKTAMAQVRTLKNALQNSRVSYTSPEGVVYETQGINLDSGYGKNRDSAATAAKINKAINKSTSAPEVSGEAAASVPEGLSRSLVGTNAEHTPVELDSEGKPQGGFQINHVRMGKYDIPLPIRDNYSSPSEANLQAMGHEEFKALQAKKRNAYTDKDPYYVAFKRDIYAGKYPWAQRDMQANLDYALDAYLKKKDIRQIAYKRIENTPGISPKEVFKNPENYGITFNWKDDYVPEKTEIVCGR